MTSPVAKATEANRITRFRFYFAYFCTRFSTIAGATALGCFLIAAMPGLAQQSVQEKQLFDQLNESRKEAGLEPLGWDENLAQAARAHSQLMASKNQLAHVLPGEPAVDARLAATGVRFNRSAENVAYNTNFGDFHKAWMESPPHRENMLSPNYNVVGIGVAQSDDGLYYATQDFAHSLAHLSETQAEEVVANAFNELRTKDGRAAMQRVSDGSVRDLACSMAQKGKLDPHKALKLPNVGEAVVYNNSRPEEMPESARKIAASDRDSKFAVGACFTGEQPRNPGGTFYVVMTFYQ
jgi:uncharacterized protein YkwD